MSGGVPRWYRSILEGETVLDHLEDRERIGRFVVLRDVDGRVHAVAANSVMAVCDDDEGALILLPGGRLIHVDSTCMRYSPG